MDLDKALANVRLNADVLAARRVGEMKAKLWRDGAADRAALGNPDPTLAQVFERAGAAVAAAGSTLAAAFGLRP